MLIRKLCRSILPLLLIAAFIASQSCAQMPSPETPLTVSAEDARWWKGNLHTHTLWSDGNHYPEMVVDWYKDHGYNFLALTDHNRLSQGQMWIGPERRQTGRQALTEYIGRFGSNWVEQQIVDGKKRVRVKPLNEIRCFFEEPDRFLLIQAEEITDKKGHFNGINLLEAIPPHGGVTARETLDRNINAVLSQSREKARPMIIQINHPNYRWHFTAEQIANTAPAGFLELYNGIGSTNFHGDPNRCGTERMWDIILTKRLAELNLPVVYATVTDDAHHYHQFGPKRANPGRGWVVVRAHRLTPESLIKAMQAGRFYGSTGIVLKNMKFDGKTLEVAIKPQFGVSYTTEFVGTLKGYDPTSRPVIDSSGAQVRATRIYSDRIGTVLTEVKGTRASYTMRGNEIYVRAKITSTKLKDNPSFEGEFEAAWVQPVIPAGK